MTTDREPGSYKDPKGYIYYKKNSNSIFRRITKYGSNSFLELEKSGIYKKAASKNFLIGYKKKLQSKNSEIELEHPKIPYLSYSHEWTFSQLKKTALFHLDFHLFLLKNDFTLSDANTHNVQFIGNKPIFIDILSIIPFKKGALWDGYQQFCESFLFPLIICALKKIPINKISQGYLNGIPLEDTYSLLSTMQRLKFFNFLHITLPTIINKKIDPKKIHSKIKDTKGLTKEKLTLLIAQIKNHIVKLKDPFLNIDSVWNDYESNNYYGAGDVAKKEKIIGQVIKKNKPKMLFDLGCNAGNFSKVALKSGAKYVVGFDFDIGALSKAFERSVNSKLNFLPLYFDATLPSTNAGWFESERMGFMNRSKDCDFVLALALEHHLIISKNIPIESFVDWLTNISHNGIVEFVPKNDQAVIELLRNREDIFYNYSVEVFERLLSKKVKIANRHIISESGRVLFEFIKK